MQGAQVDAGELESLQISRGGSGAKNFALQRFRGQAVRAHVGEGDGQVSFGKAFALVVQ